MNWQEFIKPELLILIPVLFFAGEAIKKSKINNAAIPFILGIAGAVLSAIYLFASTSVSGAQEVATAVFTALTQGVLVAAASVYGDQLLKQATKSKEEAKEKEEEKAEHDDSVNKEGE